ncbi:MAG: 2-hydroxyacid dehydrogenase [Pseudorhodoplanes sp.]
MTGGKPDILIYGPVMPTIVEQLGGVFTVHKLWEAKDRDKLIGELSSSLRALVASFGQSGLDGGFFAHFPKLEIISSFGVGYNHVDVDWAAAHGVVVTNTPDVLTEEVADTALGLLLATLRELPAAERYLRAGKWPQAPYPLTATLRDRKIGILGMGRIGKAIARRLEAFGVPISYCGRHRQTDLAYPYYADVVAMARDVDVLIAIVPANAETDRMIDMDVFKALGPRGILINVARGSVVDEQALIKALQDKTIASAGLDVFLDEPNVPQELIAMDHIVLLPHVASASRHTRNAMAQLVVDNVLRWFEGKPPLTPVAETPWPPRPRK